MTTSPKTGDLRVWWVPQVPMKAFYVSVESPEEAKKMLDTLARYDQFQLDNDIKPDYCNAGGLQCFNQEGVGSAFEQEWADWYDEETGDGIDEWSPEDEGVKP
jgi:hypothetical protein